MNIKEFVQQESESSDYGFFLKGKMVTARKTAKGGVMLTVNVGKGTSQIYIKQDMVDSISVTPDGEICCRVEVSRDAFVGYVEDAVF